MRPVITVSDQVDAEAARILGEGLGAFNIATTGLGTSVPLTVLVRDEAGAVRGGVIARTYLGLLVIQTVYLPEALRGSDIGTEMMGLAETEARRRGCRGGVVDTLSFQAPGFYQRLGWRVFGDIPCLPEGMRRLYLTKDFD